MFVLFPLGKKTKRQCKTNEKMLQDGADAAPENLLMATASDKFLQDSFELKKRKKKKKRYDMWFWLLSHLLRWS